MKIDKFLKEKFVYTPGWNPIKFLYFIFQRFLKDRPKQSYANGGLEVSPLNPYSYPQGSLPRYLSPNGVSGIGDTSDLSKYSYSLTYFYFSTAI